MKFAANISTMFKQLDMGDRFNEAYASGFEGLEVQFLYNTDKLSAIIEGQKSTPIPLVMMNSPFEPGPLFPPDDYDCDPSLAAAMNYATRCKSLSNLKHRSSVETKIVDPWGLACLPGNELEFGNSIVGCMPLCDLMDCRKLHILSGKTPRELPFNLVEETFINNMKWAISELEEYNIVALIEPLCDETMPNYYLNSFEQAVRYIELFNSDNLKLLLDVYHLYKIEGDVEAGLRRYLPYAGHVQISQSPGRIDPFQAGDINYANVLQIIKESSYDDFIGLEYTPVGAVPDYSWMENYKDFNMYF